MLRLGILGAARIAPQAVITPAKTISGVDVAAVAARARARGEAFAAKHGIPQLFDSYEALLDAPDIDAVYIPLPNGLHGRWAVRALEAGKHVLCEKPIAANADEARIMADAAKASSCVLMEAFHYRYHPLAARMKEIVDSGELGDIKFIHSSMCVPLLSSKDIRWKEELAGGASMDCGCYAINIARFVGGEFEVRSATAKLRSPNVDRAIDADIAFHSGVLGRLSISMWSSKLIKISLRVVGTKGELRVLNPVMPQFWHRLIVEADGRKRVENAGKRPTFFYQLEAFRDACLHGANFPTTAEDGVQNMRMIDEVYRAAGLTPRQPAM